MSITTMNQSVRSRSSRFAALAVSLGLVVAACGGDDDTTEPAEEATAEESTAEESTAEEPATEEASADEPSAEEPSAEAGADAPKLAIVYSAEWQDGSWGEFAYDGANSLLEGGLVSDVSL